MDSILNSIKKPLGIEADDDTFDSDIIMHINMAFMNLHQMGIGPPEGFMVQDKSTPWSDFIPDMKTYQALESYVYMKVKLVFDPPGNSSAIKVHEEAIKEIEWRLVTAAELAQNTETEEVE